jgi:hypothetical protein
LTGTSAGAQTAGDRQLSKQDGLLKWVGDADYGAGVRVASIKVGSKLGVIVIEHVKADIWRAEVRITLMSASERSGAHHKLEEAAQQWLEAVRGEPA